MDPIWVGAIVFACTFIGALVGMWLSSAMPEHHLSGDSKDTVKVGIGLIATMSALVLGLITASAKSSFDAVDSTVKQAAIQLLSLDRVLARYGSEAANIRGALKQAIGGRIEEIWPAGKSAKAALDPMQSSVGAEALVEAIRALKPQDDAQKALQARALDLAESLLQSRWLIAANTGASVPAPFLAILVLWLIITFTSFGLFGPPNTTVITVLFVCALSVASSIFLVLEMDAPFEGIMKVSADPLRNAYMHMNR